MWVTFYPIPITTVHFLKTLVPQLKASLSQTLSRFLPPAGNLIIDTFSNDLPEIRYSPGDTVSIAFAEVDESIDFIYLTGHQARDADVSTTRKSQMKIPTNKVRATFIMQKNDIQFLKNQAAEKVQGITHLSTFTVIMFMAYVWVCWVRSAAEAEEEVDENEPEYLGLTVDSRNRTDPPVPTSYFGNCLAIACPHMGG